MIPGILFFLLMPVPGRTTPPDSPDITTKARPIPMAWLPDKVERFQEATPNLSAEGAAGLDLNFMSTARPLCFPIFLISAADSPRDIPIDDLAAQVKQTLFGPGGDQAYLNAVFTRGQIPGNLLDPKDFYDVRLNGGTWNDYLSGTPPYRCPNRRMIADLAKVLKGEEGTSTHLNWDRTGKAISDSTIDAAIFILVISPRQVYSYRAWLDDSIPAEKDRTISGATNVPLTLNSCIVMSAFAHPAFKPMVTPTSQALLPGYLSHELLHLFSIPDLYDRHQYGATGGCGYWCIMSFGMFGKNQNSTGPVWPCSWVRERLGLAVSNDLTPTAGNTEMTIALATGTANPGMAKIPLGWTRLAGAQREAEHYLLVKLRGQSLGNEHPLWQEQIPGRGFLVWEVDETVGASTYGSSNLNPYWPCTYSVKLHNQTILYGQNDNKQNPLIGLLARSEFANGSPSGNNGELAHNFEVNEDRGNFSPEQFFTNPNDQLKHPLGVTLSNWNPVKGTFTVNYTQTLADKLNSPEANASIASAPADNAPAQLAPTEPETASAPAPSPTPDSAGAVGGTSSTPTAPDMQSTPNPAGIQQTPVTINSDIIPAKPHATSGPTFSVSPGLAPQEPNALITSNKQWMLASGDAPITGIQDASPGPLGTFTVQNLFDERKKPGSNANKDDFHLASSNSILFDIGGSSHFGDWSNAGALGAPKSTTPNPAMEYTGTFFPAIPPAAPSTPIMHAAPAIFGNQDTRIIKGNGDAVKDQLPDKLGDCLAPVLKAYPKDSNVGYNTTDNENFWFHTQLNRSPKAATDLKQQINTLDHVFGDEVKQVRASVAGEVAALVTSKNMPTLLSAVQNAHTVYIVPFVTIGGDQVRVKGIEASLTRGNDPDRITTSFKGLVKLPETFDATTAKFFQTKDTVKQYLEKRGFRIPDGSRWEKTIENGTGRLLWECTITSPIGTSVTIEVPDEATLDDAARINIR